MEKFTCIGTRKTDAQPHLTVIEADNVYEAWELANKVFRDTFSPDSICIAVLSGEHLPIGLADRFEFLKVYDDLNNNVPILRGVYGWNL